ncbi:MAG TPA: 1,2-phenylacetyl-CoA epoxidase subunit PaaD [Steroidobacteraceae bacterium]|nr:1,2-phenylacetyl-CoA epoxidase subunit PaaD [Steroidobacteraceae bacterium]
MSAKQQPRAPLLEAAAAERTVWRLLESVMDPEIPVLSVIDLGIVRHVRTTETGAIEVGVSPTYSGCPATEVIRGSIAHALRAAGFDDARTVDVLSPPWSSDWITPAGREKLRAFGIAPPAVAVSSPRQMLAHPPVACPRCGSEATERVSEFGSTPCKAHYRCRTCAEPFDYFKCI